LKGELQAHVRWREALQLRVEAHIWGLSSPGGMFAENLAVICCALARQDLGLEPIQEPSAGPTLDFSQGLPPEAVL
jgi:hypothetical protein